MSKPCEDACGCEATPAEGNAGSGASEASGNWISVYTVPKMDCPSEERMIRLALNGFEDIRGLSFDLSDRRLKVVHDGEAEPITAKLATLGLGASLQETAAADPESIKAVGGTAISAEQESGTLRWLLGINAVLFAVEMTAGLIAQSTGLIAESLDNFADAAVYGLALYAVGHSVKMQVRAAHLAGVLQLILAVGALAEVVRRFVFGSEPESLVMIGDCVHRIDRQYHLSAADIQTSGGRCPHEGELDILSQRCGDQSGGHYRWRPGGMDWLQLPGPYHRQHRGDYRTQRCQAHPGA